MNRQQKQLIFNDMKRGIRPGCLPMGVIGFVEYRKDIYNQGEPIKTQEGQIAVSQDGNKKYTKDGGIWDIGAKLRFKTAEDLLKTKPDEFIVENVNEKMLDEMRRLYEGKNKTHVVFPWHYGTLLTRCQIKFGWEPLLEASALEPEALAEILDRVGESTMRVLEGWSRLDDVYMIIVHDDIAGSRGLIWSPDFLKKYVFPWYRRFFETIHGSGKKVLYITDGNYTEVLDDILFLKPDGLFCESSSMEPECLMEKGGPDLFYLLKTDSRTMDFGNPEEIESEVMKIRNLHERFPRIFSYTGGGMRKPENLQYFEKMYNKYLVY